MLGTSALGSTVYGWDYLREPAHLHLKQIDVHLPNLPPAFDGYRIVNLTDIHLGPSIAYESVTHAAKMTADLEPDLIVLTGDFVTEFVDEGPLYTTLRSLSAPDGVWAVMGNHDHWSDVEAVRRIVQQAGVIELRNAHIRIERGCESLYLAGVDDIWEQKHDLAAALDGIPANATTILLAHEPDYADEVAPTNRVALQLSGHSHGGQVAIPLIEKPVLSEFVHLARKYPRGLYQIGSMWLYTSAGLGRSWVPRVHASPELTEITLRGS